ncbi:MAG: MFS transporter [Acidobacteriota bacterium]|nr:MFS transporter [Acidobacteriota bacterium]
MVRSLKHRNFQLFFSGQLISLVGTWMDTAAEALLVYRLTGSSLLLGTVAFAGQIPISLFAPAGGFVADRFDRRKVVIGTQTASMLLAGALAFLTLSHRVTVNQVIVLAAAMGIVNAFDIPTRQAFLVEMVGREDLMNAIALNSSMFQGARVIGPVVAGIIVYKIGEGWCFFGNSISYVAVIVGLILMRIAPKPRHAEARLPPVEHIREGFRFARNTAPIRAILMLIALVSLVAMPYSVLMPVFAEDVLRGTARTYGVLMGAVGVGACFGALTLASRRGVNGLGRLVAIACGAFGTFMILFSFSRIYLLSICFLVPMGFSMMTQNASANTLIQVMVPDRLRGRIMSVYSMLFMGMAPVGSLLYGALAERVGAPYTLALGGSIAILGALFFAYNLPKIRVRARELIIAQGMVGGEPAEQMTTRIVE